jgi:antitoxin HicB
MKKKNKHIGSSIDDLMKEEGWYEEAEEKAIKEVIACQLSQAMEKKHISKSTMATRLKTSRTQMNRILNVKSDVTLSSLQRAAALVGRCLKIQLV